MLAIVRVMALPTLSLFAMASGSRPAAAQDVPGIENCMAEKQIERRTGCLQSNINYLKTALATEANKVRVEARARLDDAVKQVDALKLVITDLQDQIKKLQAEVKAATTKVEQPKPGTK
jgi:hypothetical protein